MKCNHKNIKKNYSHGKKSKPNMACKDCGAIVKPKDLLDIRQNEKKRRRR